MAQNQLKSILTPKPKKGKKKGSLELYEPSFDKKTVTPLLHELSSDDHSQKKIVLKQNTEQINIINSGGEEKEGKRSNAVFSYLLLIFCPMIF